MDVTIETGSPAQATADVLAAVHNTLELAVLSMLAIPQRLHQVRDNRDLKSVVEAYVEPLRQAGLIADDSEYRRRMPAFILVSAVLFALAAVKIVIALGRGHSNVMFLVILAVIALETTIFAQTRYPLLFLVPLATVSAAVLLRIRRR